MLREIHAALDQGDLLDGLTGLEELTQLMKRREERELESRLAVLSWSVADHSAPEPPVGRLPALAC